MSAMLSIRIDEKLLAQLDELATATRRSRSYLAAEALQQYVDLQLWQVGQILEGIKDADAGRTIPHEEVDKWLASLEAKFEDKAAGLKKRAS